VDDWLSFLLLFSGMIGLLIIYLMNRHTRIKIRNKKTNQLQDRMNQVLYFDASFDSLVEEAGEFTPKQLTQYFGSLFPQFRNQESSTGKLITLFRKLNLTESCIEAYKEATYEEKLSMLDDFKVLPVSEITHFLISILCSPNPEPIILKAGEALAAHKTIETLPVFLIQTVPIPIVFNEAIASVICSFQADFPGFVLDKQDPRIHSFESKIEARYSSFLKSQQQLIMTAGLYVLGLLGLYTSITRILEAIQTTVGRECLHVACTAMKKCSQDKFLQNLATWIFMIEDWNGEEIQNLLSVFSYFNPAGEDFINQLVNHPQLIVKVSAKAALR